MGHEWDEAKAAANFVKHGVDFLDAIKIFLDSCRVEEEDFLDKDGEARFKAIGLVEGCVLVVLFTYRNGDIRIISARKAESYERRKYHEG